MAPWTLLCVPVRAGILALGLLVLAGTAQAQLTFNVTYDPNLTNMAPMATIKSAFGVAEQYFSSTFSDNITININVNADNTGLASSISSGFNSTYNAIYNALKGDRTSAADNTAFSSGTVPNADPLGSLTNLTTANAKAIGLLSGTAAGVDGTVFFSTNVSYAFGTSANDPARATAGKYDFVGVAEHEISEVMGRISWLDIPTKGNYLMDLFRYTGAGVRNTSIPGPTGVSFSYNNGTNLGTEFSSQYGYVTNDFDPNDWSTNNAVDAFNAVATKGVLMALSATDTTVMDVIGYDVPEPGTLALATVGALASLGYCGSRRRARRLSASSARPQISPPPARLPARGRIHGRFLS